HHVVDLVRAGVSEVLALEQDPHTQAIRQPPAFGHWSRATYVVAQERGVLAAKGRIPPGRTKRGLELLARPHQRLGHEPTPEPTEAAGGAGLAHHRPEGRRDRHRSALLPVVRTGVVTPVVGRCG